MRDNVYTELKSVVDAYCRILQRGIFKKHIEAIETKIQKAFNEIAHILQSA